MKQLPRFVHPSSLELYSYWNARRGARAAPFRSEIEPSDISDILPDIFILDIEGSHQRYTWRLAGTRLCTLHCRELKGRDFMSDWTGANEESMRTLLRTVADKNLVGVLEITGRNTRGQNIEMEMVLMPLHIKGSQEVRIFGALLPLEEPYWIGISPPVQREIQTTRLIWPGTPLREPLPRYAAVSGEREPAPLLFMPQPKMRRVRHLIVLEGGKDRVFSEN